jgi:lipopolysaccharide/colanic/teichoic acid biosynthesis glycosyltransferase
MATYVLPVQRGYGAAKRALDLGICFILFPAFVLVLAACAIAIWIDSPGPVIFKQERTGRHGHRFGMYKFRTMVANAEALKADLQHLSIVPLPDFKIIEDPRITRIGRFLRKTSLDELPQLVNVIRGEMSLVGPRPTSFAPSTYDLWHTERLEVLPGLTGLWQVVGRNAATFDERLRLDIEYIDRMSLGLDLWILLRTVLAVVRRSGA